MGNRIKPRLWYVVAMPNYASDSLDGVDAYFFVANDSFGQFSAFQDYAHHFDSLSQAKSLARYIPGSFVATVLESQS
jgi:hypothetical protein